ncbi:MAG: prolipoprotein diacylglyceryl transferase [Bacilli bacterium]|nr:prolipoprotein diacylglyceryl transferase [Bacilli bacterium]
MDNLFYILFIILGFTLPFASCIVINKKFKTISLEYLFYSYILFLICFIVFAKIFYIILEFDINSLNLFITTDNIVNKLKFILSGYSFIGGYIGGIFSIFIFSKITKNNFKNLLVIYLPSLILIYIILKIGCFIKGCCGSYIEIPIQLIESVANLVVYIYILSNLKRFDKNKIIAISFIGFGICRFILSFVRVYFNLFSFLFVQMFCLVLIIIGTNFLKLGKNSKI